MTTIAMPLPTQQTPIVTASGILSLLSEPDATLVSHALTKLLTIVDTQWHEIAEVLPDLEAIAEGGAVNLDGNDDDDENMATAGDDTIYDIPTRQTAAAIASRVFFHLEEPRQALRLALDSGDDNFNVLCPSIKDVAYVEKLVNAAIGEYVKRKQREFDGDDNDEAEEEKKKEEEEEEELDMNKLHNVVQLMFQRCYADKSYGHALGVAFEAREATKVEEILEKLSSSSSSSSDSSNNTNNSIVETLKYAVISAHTLIPSKSFRFKALELIASSLTKVFEDDNSGSSSSSSSNGATAAAKRNAAFTLALCRQLLGQANAVGGIIVQLIDSSNSSDDDDDMALLGLQLCFDIIDSGDQAFVNAVAGCLPKKEEQEGEEAKVVVEGEPSPIRSEATWAHFTNAHRILTGGFTSELSVSFLYKNSNSDKLLMSNLKKSLEEQRTMSRNSVLHNCAVTAHGYLNAGTTDDSFLRDNLDWMKKASNW